MKVLQVFLGVLICLALGLPPAMGQVELVSINSAGTQTGNISSSIVSTGECNRAQRCMSADGRFVVFESLAADLVANDANNAQDVFVRDRQTDTTILVSVNTSGMAGNSASVGGSISADGRFVAFASAATDLVAAPVIPLGPQQVYVRDLMTNTTELVSIDSLGGPGDSSSLEPIISANGNRVAFASFASNLTAVPDPSGIVDIFVRDLVSDTTTQASLDNSGTSPPNGNSSDPVLSADGNRVAFLSSGSNLVPTDTNGQADVFVRDLMANTTTLASINNGETDSGNGTSSSVVLSGDGNRVGFVSAASDLAPTDTNGQADVFVRDLVAGTTFLASINSAGNDSGSGDSGQDVPSLSSNGQFIVFGSSASDLVATDTNGLPDVFVRDLMNGMTTLASVNLAGTDSAFGISSQGVLDEAGSLVSFQSTATDLVGVPTTGLQDVFVRNLAMNDTGLVSINTAGTMGGNNTSLRAQISANGNVVVFDSAATDLVTVADMNSNVDIFAAPVSQPAQPSISIDDVMVAEGDAGTMNATFTVTLSAASASTVAVEFATADGTAMQPGDYNAASGTVTFAANDTSETITITVNGDTLDEANETFFVNLTNPSGATIADGTGRGTIINDDPRPSLSINDVTVTEGNSGTPNAVFTVSLSAVSGLDVMADFATADGTATLANNDYTQTTGTLTVPAGSASGTISVPVVGDTAVEANETFLVSLANPVNATIAVNQGQGTITDDDTLPSISINDVTVTEGDTLTTNANFTVSLSAVSGLDVMVEFATADGTATQFFDYTMTSGTLTIPAGMLSGTFNVPVVSDTTVEGDETFSVNLSNAVNGAITDNQGQGTITNDDIPAFTISASLSPTNNRVPATGGTVSLGVTVNENPRPLPADIMLDCPGLRTGWTCAFMPSSISGNIVLGMSNLVITVPARMASSRSAPGTTGGAPAYASWLIAAGMLAVAGGLSRTRGRDAGRKGACFTLLLLLALGVTGCPEDPEDPVVIEEPMPEEVMVTIRGTSGNLEPRTATVTVLWEQ